MERLNSMVYDELNYLNMSTLRQLSCRHEICHHFVQGLIAGFAQVSVLSNLVEEWSLGGADVLGELLLELCDLGGVHLVEESPDAAVDDGHLLLDGHGHVLALLQQLSQPDAAVQQLLRGGVQVGAELGEGRNLTVLGQLKLHRTGHLFHGLCLGG